MRGKETKENGKNKQLSLYEVDSDKKNAVFRMGRCVKENGMQGNGETKKTGEILNPLYIQRRYIVIKKMLTVFRMGNNQPSLYD